MFALKDLIICETIRKEVESKARTLAREFKWIRLEYEDFVSVFNEEIWKISVSYSWANEYYLFETVLKALENRGKDIVYKANADKRVATHMAIQPKDGLEEIPDSLDVIEEVTYRIFLDQLLNDSVLTEIERTVIMERYLNPKISNRRLALKIGSADHKIIPRILRRTYPKIHQYLSFDLIKNVTKDDVRKALLFFLETC